MKIKLFDDFINESKANEGMMSNIDIIFQQSSSKEEFKKDVKAFLAQHAAKKSVADDEQFIEDLAMTFFDDEGNKKDMS
jgi:hypothetical protein